MALEGVCNQSIYPEFVKVVSGEQNKPIAGVGVGPMDDDDESLVLMDATVEEGPLLIIAVVLEGGGLVDDGLICILVGGLVDEGLICIMVGGPVDEGLICIMVGGLVDEGLIAAEVVRVGTIDVIMLDVLVAIVTVVVGSSKSKSLTNVMLEHRRISPSATTPELMRCSSTVILSLEQSIGLG